VLNGAARFDAGTSTTTDVNPEGTVVGVGVVVEAVASVEVELEVVAEEHPAASTAATRTNGLPRRMTPTRRAPTQVRLCPTI
jgi:hypothetical protein